MTNTFEIVDYYAKGYPNCEDKKHFKESHLFSDMLFSSLPHDVTDPISSD